MANKKFRLWYSDKAIAVDSFEQVNEWFKSGSAGNEVRYKGGYWTDKSKEWGDEWKKAYILNYISKSGRLYLDIAYCNFLDTDYIVQPTADVRVQATVTDGNGKVIGNFDFR